MIESVSERERGRIRQREIQEGREKQGLRIRQRETKRKKRGKR